jgi:tetratricopeptide (TPR) repeat protein
MVVLSIASLVATGEGRLAQAKELASAARHVADSGDLSQTPQNSLAHAATGAVLAREGRLEEARNELQRALRSRRRWPGLSPWPTLETLFRLAPVLLDMGDRPGAAALLDEARDILTLLPDGAEAQLGVSTRCDAVEKGREIGIALSVQWLHRANARSHPWIE